ncbi:MAG: LLM class flavin-dependent oxidoreductase [Haloglomus sp.]
MRIGTAVPSFAGDGYRLPTGYLGRYARRAEELGFAGVWTTEHLIPPPAYNTSRLDPLATIATLAGETETVGVGTSILILPMRDPVMVAKRAATIQHLSGDRLTLGFGVGWYDKEFESVGVPFDERGPRFTEGLELLRRLFTEDEVTFDGEYYSVEEFTLEPRPSRPPRIVVGGGSEEIDGERRVLRAVKERILQHADGWIGATRNPEVLTATWNDIAAYLEDHGRDPGSLDRLALNYGHLVPGTDGEVARKQQRKIYGRAVGPDRSVDFAMRHNLSGSVEEIRDDVAAFRDEGFDQLIIGPMAYDRTELDAQLEHFGEELLPLV